MVGFRFHTSHGSNLELDDGSRIARRFRSFANAIAFSNRPLLPGETFLFEIEDQEMGWAGHIRCGVTIHNPIKLRSLPQYLLPDFAQLTDGKCASWVFAIKPSEEMPFGDDFIGIPIHCNDAKTDPLQIKEKNYKTLKAHDNILPTDLGSRIGIHVTLGGELFFFINGTQFGPCASDVPVEQKDVFAVVDLYGVTKQIRTIQVAVPTLEEYCQDVIKQHLTEKEIANLDLPIKILEQLQSLR